MMNMCRSNTILLIIFIALAALASAHVEIGDVDEYWQKRAQENRVRRSHLVGPINDLLAAAGRFHQDLIHRTINRRSLLSQPTNINGNDRDHVQHADDDRQVPRVDHSAV